MEHNLGKIGVFIIFLTVTIEIRGFTEVAVPYKYLYPFLISIILVLFVRYFFLTYFDIIFRSKIPKEQFSIHFKIALVLYMCPLFD